jgi:hypothetical protein
MFLKPILVECSAFSISQQAFHIRLAIGYQNIICVCSLWETKQYFLVNLANTLWKNKNNNVWGVLGLGPELV